MRLNNHWTSGALSGLHNLDGVKAIYLNSVLRNMAGSLSGVFLPIYIFYWGGLPAVAWLVLLERGFVTINSLFLGKVVVKIGYKWSVMLSSVFLAIFYLLVTYIDLSYGLILVLSIVTSLVIPLYWLPRLSIISTDGVKKEMGKEVGTIQILEKTSSIAGPVLGGIILSSFGFDHILMGFQNLFGVALVLTLISGIPLFFIRNYQIDDGVSVRGFWNWLTDQRNKHLTISFWGQGWANLVDAYFWPIYFFIFVGDFVLFGGISSLIIAISTLMSYVAGKFFDKLRRKRGKADEKEYTVSTILVGGLQLIRSVVPSAKGLFALDAIFSSVLPFWSVDYDSYLFAAGNRNGKSLVFYTYREIWYSFSRFVGGSILLISFLFGVSWWSWVLVFTMGGVGTLLTIGMQKES